MTNDPNDRFGVSEELIRRVIAKHAGLIRFGCYVPTRLEVATKPPEWIGSILNAWFWESPEELAPDLRQVADAVAILRARPDADHPAIQTIIADAPEPDV